MMNLILFLRRYFSNSVSPLPLAWFRHGQSLLPEDAMDPLVVDLDSVMEEDDWLEVAGAHPEFFVCLPDDRPLLLRDVRRSRSTSFLEDRYSSTLSVLSME